MKKTWIWVILALCVVMLLCAIVLSKPQNKEPMQTDGMGSTQPTNGTPGADSVEDLDDLPVASTSDVTEPAETVLSSEATQGASGGEEASTPTQTQIGETKPSEPPAPSETTEPEEAHKQLTFAEYLALDAAGRQAYVETFPSMQEAMLWYETAKKIYDESQDKIEISGGNIDLGDIMDSMGK